MKKVTPSDTMKFSFIPVPKEGTPSDLSVVFRLLFEETVKKNRYILKSSHLYNASFINQKGGEEICSQIIMPC